MKCQHCDKEVFSTGYHDVKEFYPPELTPEQTRDELFKEMKNIVVRAAVVDGVPTHLKSDARALVAILAKIGALKGEG